MAATALALPKPADRLTTHCRPSSGKTANPKVVKTANAPPPVIRGDGSMRIARTAGIGWKANGQL